MNNVEKVQAVIALYNATHEDKKKGFFNEETAFKLLSSMEHHEETLTEAEVALLTNNCSVIVDPRHIVAVTGICRDRLTVQMVFGNEHSTFVISDGVLFHGGDSVAVGRFRGILENGDTCDETWVPAYVQTIKFFDSSNLEDAVKRVVQDAMTAVDAAYNGGYEDGE